MGGRGKLTQVIAPRVYSSSKILPMMAILMGIASATFQSKCYGAERVDFHDLLQLVKGMDPHKLLLHLPNGLKPVVGKRAARFMEELKCSFWKTESGTGQAHFDVLGVCLWCSNIRIQSGRPQHVEVVQYGQKYIMLVPDGDFYWVVAPFLKAGKLTLRFHGDGRLPFNYEKCAYNERLHQSIKGVLSELRAAQDFQDGRTSSYEALRKVHGAQRNNRRPDRSVRSAVPPHSGAPPQATCAITVVSSVGPAGGKMEGKTFTVAAADS